VLLCGPLRKRRQRPKPQLTRPTKTDRRRPIRNQQKKRPKKIQAAVKRRRKAQSRRWPGFATAHAPSRVSTCSQVGIYAGHRATTRGESTLPCIPEEHTTRRHGAETTGNAWSRPRAETEIPRQPRRVSIHHVVRGLILPHRDRREGATARGRNHTRQKPRIYARHRRSTR
jgi:hypothetical protein